MATFQVSPPEAFDFSQPDSWPKWIRRFERFRQASGLQDKAEKSQVNTLIYTMGDKADDLLSSFGLSDEEEKKYSTVKAKFDGYFVKRRNVIFERARFNSRKQLKDESVDSFITDLFSLVEHCGYGQLRDEMVRDRLVVGLLDASLSEKMQLDSELTLDKALSMARHSEAVRKQQPVVRGTAQQNDLTVEHETIDTLTSKNVISPRQRSFSYPTRNESLQSAQKCSRCGKSPRHGKQQCLARASICKKCNKTGHYTSCCFTRGVSHVTASTENNDSDEDTFLGSVELQGESQWFATVCLNKKDVEFKLDTGAEVTVISETTFSKFSDIKLKRPTKALFGPTKSPLKAVGQFTGCFQYLNTSCKLHVFVVKDLKINLLGLPAITALNLIARVQHISSSKESVFKSYPKVFQGLGTLGKEYKIPLKPDSKPYALHTARRVPISLRKEVEREIKRMESLKVISPIDGPSQWCAGMVVIPKSSGKVRICVDMKPLNENVMREFHPLPAVDETLAQLSGARIFTKLDANSGFWQIPLAQESRPLTTFITPYGRYQFNVLPFGITCAPELFQKRMNVLLKDLDGVLCLMDDVLVYGKSQSEHDERLEAVLKRIEECGMTLNSEKCEFSKTQVKFLGHIIDQNGVRADPAKTEAIIQMAAPQNTTELRRFTGMVNQLSKFIPNCADYLHPLNSLLSKKNVWLWGPSQEQAFVTMKEKLSYLMTLALYNPARSIKLSADASSYGVGSVLLQENDGKWQPIAYASRTMSDTEKRYAQIEKEALALTWAAEKFSMYLLGRSFCMETDHKPLVPLLSTKNLDDLPPRVLRFRLRLMRYNFSIIYTPGKFLYISDALSRSPLPQSTDSHDLQEPVEAYIANVVSSLPATPGRLDTLRTAQKQDKVLSQVAHFCKVGWPEKKPNGPTAKFWFVRGELSLYDDLLLRGQRIVIPSDLREDTLQRLHEGHQGMVKCRLRARDSVWWPGISSDISNFIHQCDTCCENFQITTEPMIPTELPKRPWEKVASDLFELKGTPYIVVVDYFSRYIEILKLTTTTSASIISALKAIFSRHGIPDSVTTDNGPQYASKEFNQFAKSYNFTHQTSSPYHPQGNGEAERAVRTVKSLLKNCTDPHLALLSYRTTPLPFCSYSPAQLLMGRHLRSPVPMSEQVLTPKWPDLGEFRQVDDQYKQKLKKQFDRRHRVRELPVLDDNTPVYISSGSNTPTTPGSVVHTAGQRTYQVQTPTGITRRNRSFLQERPVGPDEQLPVESESSYSGEETERSQSTVVQRSPILTRSKTGTAINPPVKLNL